MPYYCLAGCSIFLGCPSWMLNNRFDAFCFAGTNADIHGKVVFEALKPSVFENPQILYDDSNTVIYYAHNTLMLRVKSSGLILIAEANPDWSHFILRVDNRYSKYQLQEEIFYFLRVIMSMILMHRNGVLIHSASIIWEDKGIAFSASSGTGKSTHVHLWQEKYSIKILDGDTTACRIIDGKPIIYGLPWCGSSNEYMNASVPLSAVVFLEQSDRNAIYKLDNTEASIRLYSRCHLAIWNENMVDIVLKTIKNIVSSSDCYVLQCRPDFEAVDLVKQCLDKSGKI